MKLQTFNSGFNVWISARETDNWAHRPGSSWPCSQLAGRRLWVQFDRNGLCDMAIDGRFRDCDATELSACVADHLTGRLPESHPCYFVAVGQFRQQ